MTERASVMTLRAESRGVAVLEDQARVASLSVRSASHRFVVPFVFGPACRGSGESMRQ